MKTKAPASSIEQTDKVRSIIQGDRKDALNRALGKKPKSKGMQPTDEQKDILKVCQEDHKVIVIEAGAGTGKTTTDRMLVDVLPGRGQYTAFNSSLVAESQAKFAGTSCPCNTTHSLAFRAIGKQYAHRLGGNRVRAYQVAKMLDLDEFSLPTAKGEKPKHIPTPLMASQIMGAIRKFCQSASTKIDTSHFKYLDGLDQPSKDGKRCHTNNDTLKAYLLPYAQKAWADIANPDGVLPFSHDCYVKIWQLGNPVISADYILLDECFPPGTLVETSEGPVAIEEIASNPDKEWLVLAALAKGKTLRYTKVTSAYKTPTRNPLVRIKHGKNEIECTANHPIWIEGKGWVPAGLVRPGDCLSYVWETNKQKANNLFSEMWGKAQRAKQGPQSRTTEKSKNIQAYETSTQGNTQSYVPFRYQSEGISNPQSKGDYIYPTGRQRQGTYQSSVTALSGVGAITSQLALEPRICCVTWSKKERISNLLQIGHRICKASSRCGSRRQVSRETRETNSRSQEGKEIAFSRVVSVEVQERANSGESHSNSQEDYQNVYTLSTEIGNYFANGVLVKNCQDTAPVFLSILEKQTKAKIILVGDSAQQIYEWRGAVNAMAAFDGAPRKLLSQAFRFGPAIADVANVVLSQLEEPTPLRLKGLATIKSRVEPVLEPTAILTRTNAVAISTLLGAITAGRKPFLVGGGSQVISFVEAAQKLQRGESTGHPELACFESWSEVQLYSQLDEGEDLKLMVKLIDGFGADVILQALKGMPQESDADLVISTAHKSKGREWKSVQIANDFPTASKACDADRKLLYVAVTRAKELLDISSCPYFTGEDAVDLSKVIANQPKPSTTTDTPDTPKATQEVPTEFTWSRMNKVWAVKGPKGAEGTTVTVSRKDGSTSQKNLVSVLWDNDTTAIYQVM